MNWCTYQNFDFEVLYFDFLKTLFHISKLFKLVLFGIPKLVLPSSLAFYISKISISSQSVNLTPLTLQ